MYVYILHILFTFYRVIVHNFISLYILFTLYLVKLVKFFSSLPGFILVNKEFQ